MLKYIRKFVGKVIIVIDALTSPSPVKRSSDDQSRLDQRTQNLELYQFENCPFCVKVRRAIKRLGLKIELRDATQNSYESELVKNGGTLQVPCLKIRKEDGSVQWMYESSDIIRYLEDLVHSK